MDVRIGFDAGGSERPEEVAAALDEFSRSVPTGNVRLRLFVFGCPETLQAVRPMPPISLLDSGSDNTDMVKRLITPEQGHHDDVARAEQLRQPWNKPQLYPNGVEIIPVVTGKAFPMDAKGTTVRSHKDSSIMVAMEMLAKGELDALVSPGNTGGTVTAAVIKLRPIRRGVGPVLPVWLPFSNGRVLLGDVGANHEPTVATLVSSSIMLATYFRESEQPGRPCKVGLLTIGEEDTKGNGTVHGARLKLNELKEGKGLACFVGSAEPYMLAEGKVTVAVCDGHTGNIVLKMLEVFLRDQILKPLSRAKALSNKASLAIANLFAGRLFTTLKGMKYNLNPDTTGGCLLLGVNGTVVVSHGTVGRDGILQAVNLAIRSHDRDIPKRLKEALDAYLGEESAKTEG